MGGVNLPGQVIQLYPVPQREVMLEGLYLHQHVEPDAKLPHVYTNFIASLDGRIAVEQAGIAKHAVPDSITNPRDWRLYQELAASADVLLVSGRYLRELVRGEAQADLPVSNEPAFDDLRKWRVQQGLAPQPAVVVLSASMDLPLDGLRAISDRRVYVATGKKAETETEVIRAIEDSGATMLYVGESRKVDGRQLVERLAAEGFCNIYSIAGPVVLETLLRGQVLNRIYFTQVHRLIGGRSYDTLLEGDLLTPPVDFNLQALYYDTRSDKNCSQFFGVYEIHRK